MNNAKIRSVNLEDLPAIKNIIDSTQLFPSALLDEMFKPSSDPMDEFWLTYGEGNPIAVAYCVPEPMTVGTWNLLLIAVRSDRQCDGIGRTVMHYIEERLRSNGARLLIVETSGTEEFVRTRKFYKSLGYDEEARIREFYDVGDDKIVFRKVL